jgi:hypothetical protein
MDYDVISQIVVPEQYKLWESNKPGVLKQPVGIAAMKPGKFAVLDLVGKTFLVRLHYPADVTLIGHNFSSPLGMTYLEFT